MSGKRPAETIQTLLEAESEAKLVVEKARKGAHRVPLYRVLEWVPPQWLALFSSSDLCYHYVAVMPVVS